MAATTERACIAGKSSDKTFLDNVIYVGRACKKGKWNLEESKWHNPFVLKKDGFRKDIISKFKSYILHKPELLNSVHELKGKTLACWCGDDQDCHTDVLIALADNLEPNCNVQTLIEQAARILELPPPQKMIRKEVIESRRKKFAGKANDNQKVKKSLYHPYF